LPRTIANHARVVFTPRAERQLDKLHAYNTEHASESPADVHIARIVAFCTGLAPFPDRGRKRDDLLPGLRTIGFQRRATIALVVSADAVLIEGIFYGGRDFNAVFGQTAAKANEPE
jgi:toxin ParE1/3/4